MNLILFSFLIKDDSDLAGKVDPARNTLMELVKMRDDIFPEEPEFYPKKFSDRLLGQEERGFLTEKMN